MRIPLHKQRGATLLVTLVMLVMLMLFAISSVNTASTNLKVVGNLQAKSEALDAAQESIETLISTPQFIASPADAVLAPCGTPNTLCTDVTGDGTPDYTTTFDPAPTCVTVRPIKNAELNFSNMEDLGCSAGQQQNFGVAGAVSGDSLCSNTVWEVTARTVGVGSGATVTVTQGVGVRISTDDAGASC